MAIVNKWTIGQMDCYPTEDGEVDVVFCAHWRVEGTDGTYIGSVYGSQGITLDADEPFVPFNELTEELVVGWVKKAMGEEQVASIEANIAQQIEDQISPKVVTPPLPWATLEAPIVEPAA